MIISDKHRFAFIHIPKCAGSTLRHTLMTLDERKHVYFDAGRSDHPALGFIDHHHLPLAVIKDHFPEDFALLKAYRSFALIRDPQERFASSLHEYLRWNTDKTLAETDPQEARRVIQQIMDKLSALGDAPVTDASLIHFSRQSDYIELDGEQIVSDLYRVGDVSQLLAEIGRITGQSLAQKDRNRRISYENPALQTVSDGAQRLLRSVLPRSLTGPAFGAVKAAMLRAGLAHTASKDHVAALEEAQFSDFVQEFYARDFALRDALNP